MVPYPTAERWLSPHSIYLYHKYVNASLAHIWWPCVPLHKNGEHRIFCIHMYIYVLDTCICIICSHLMALCHCRKTNNTTYCVYTHARTYIHTHTCTCMYICVKMCMCTHVLNFFIFVPFAHVMALCPAANRFSGQPSTYIYAYTCIINASLAHIRWLLVPLQKTVTGWRRCRECLISMRHFPQQSPIIHGSFAERDLHLKAFSAFSPSCETTCCVHTYKCVYIYGKFVLYSLLAYN